MSIPDGIEVVRISGKRRRARRAGDPLARLMSKIARAENGCWEWQGQRFKRTGYGRFRAPGIREELAHRWAWLLLRDAIPEGLELHHRCENRCCVNPDHLETRTRRDHMAQHLTGQKTGARNRAKTHCPRGHEYNEENTHHTPRGRSCRACAREKARERNGYGRPRAKSHCPQSHAYDETNTYVDPRGNKHCRICKLASQRRHYARKRGSDVNT